MNRVFAWPVGRVSGVEQSDLIPRIIYLLGALTGGFALGIVLAWVVGIAVGIPAIIREIVAVFALPLSLLQEVRGQMGWWPQVRRQVPREWLQNGTTSASWRFGVTLGFGVLTYLHHPAFYGIVVLAIATGSPWSALMVGLAFGLIRGVQPLAFGILATTPARASRLEELVSARTVKRFGRLLLVFGLLAAALLILI